MSDTASIRERRHCHYVDPIIQRRLTIGLICLEASLIVIALWVLHGQLNTLIDDNLFRIHPLPTDSLLTPLIYKLARVGLGFVAANLVLVGVAYRLWWRYVEQVSKSLGDILIAARELDLRESTTPTVTHEVLERAIAWQEHERLRCKRLAEAADALEAAEDPPDTLYQRITTLLP